MAQSPLSKVGRVKVGVRCRPAFQDEIDFAKGEFISIVDTRTEAIGDPSLGQLSLTLASGKQREFLYDYVFNPDATQDQVYSRIAKPVVADVLKGFNGTIFAYGQTGTGKTYTMGILEFISNEHAGIIPRAVAQIFHYVEHQGAHHSSNEITISLSFLQLYRETIQDLLAPASGSATPADDNLLIREDPQRGFYVEGLQEFVVRNYEESEALINLGLENRAIAPTLMNATSSRSHTVLTINIEQRVTTDVQAGTGGTGTAPNTPSPRGHGSGGGGSAMSRRPAQYTKTLRSKLLMVDLAGSERVRRTVSKGARLSEAKSINTSLSALGNVIAALAEANVSHIPYRDSKLTRLLQDSLGGTARTALIATVGPAAINYGETQSTLMFATRCMSVKTVPIQHAEVDYAEMCAALQAKVNEMEGVTTERLLQQQEGYEQTIRELRNQLELERTNAAQHQLAIAQHSRDAAKAAFSSELRTLLEQVERVRKGERVKVTARGRDGGGSGTGGGRDGGDVQGLECWLNKPVGFSLTKTTTTTTTTATTLKGVPVDAQQAQLLAYCFEVISQLSSELHHTLQRNTDREELTKTNLSDEFSAQEQREAHRLREKAAMDAEDPRNKHNSAKGRNKTEMVKIGSHLAPMSQLDALRRVEGQYRSNNDPVTHIANTTTTNNTSTNNNSTNADAQLLLHQMSQPLGTPVQVTTRTSLFNYTSIEEVATALTNMHQGIRENLASVKTLLARKDAHFQNVKEALTLQMVEKRKREEEVINWSYILKYLLGSASKLRRAVTDEKTHTTATTLLHLGSGSGAGQGGAGQSGGQVGAGQGGVGGAGQGGAGQGGVGGGGGVLDLPVPLPASLSGLVPPPDRHSNSSSNRVSGDNTIRHNGGAGINEGSYFDTQSSNTNHTNHTNNTNNASSRYNASINGSSSTNNSRANTPSRDRFEPSTTNNSISNTNYNTNNTNTNYNNTNTSTSNNTSIVPPGRPRSSSRGRERGGSESLSHNQSQNQNQSQGGWSSLDPAGGITTSGAPPHSTSAQHTQRLRQPSPLPSRGGGGSGIGSGSGGLGAGVETRFSNTPQPPQSHQQQQQQHQHHTQQQCQHQQYQSTPGSPPYSNLDDSDLSVGSTVHSHNTHNTHTTHNTDNNNNNQYQVPAVPHSLSNFRANVPTFQPASNNHQAYSQMHNNHNQHHQQHQQQQSPAYREPPSPVSTRSTRDRSYSNGNSGGGGGGSGGGGGNLRASSREDYEFATPMSHTSHASHSSHTSLASNGGASVPRQPAPRGNNNNNSHSQFAQEVVQDLGVDSTQASAAMSVIDKVTMITDEQLAQLDAATRAQILQIRRELGIAGAGASAPQPMPVSTSTSVSQRRATPGPASVPKRGDNYAHLPPPGVRNMQYYAPQQQPVPKRSSSAPRQRSLSGGSASYLSQAQQPGAYSGQSTPSSAQAPRSSSRGRGSPRQDYAPPGEAFTPYAAPPSRGSQSQQGGSRYAYDSPQAQYQQYYDDDDDNYSQLDML